VQANPSMLSEVSSMMAKMDPGGGLCGRSTAPMHAHARAHKHTHTHTHTYTHTYTHTHTHTHTRTHTQKLAPHMCDSAQP